MAIASRQRKTNRRYIWYAGALVVVLICGIATLEATGVTHFWHKNSIIVTPSGQQLQQEAKANADKKLQAVENPQTNQTSPPVPENSNITISASKGADGTETMLTSLGNVASGTCTIDITNGNKHTSQTADVIYQPQSSSCAGFSVPISDLGAGSWQITLSVTSNGAVANKTITETVK